MTPNKEVQIPIDVFQDFKCQNYLRPIELGPLELCNGTEFEQVFRIKTYKGLMSNNQKVIMQIPLIKCCKCGKTYDLNAK